MGWALTAVLRLIDQSCCRILLVWDCRYTRNIVLHPTAAPTTVRRNTLQFDIMFEIGRWLDA